MATQIHERLNSSSHDTDSLVAGATGAAEHDTDRAPVGSDSNEIETPVSDSSQAASVDPSQNSALSETQFHDLPACVPLHTSQGASLPPEMSGLKIGQVLSDRYEVQAHLGAGGMGMVFAAHDRETDSRIAIKVLLPSLLTDADARRRFENEAEIASSLSHANIVDVYGIHEDNGVTYITMELLEGRSLRTEIMQRTETGSRFSVAEVQRISDQLCSALQAAHSSTIHRDVKPENVWLNEDGAAKLMDFGIARVMRPSHFTTQGLSMGTAYYMAPEQLRGDQLDHRADQYAVGVMLYELLTGEIPQGAVQAPHALRRSLPLHISEAVMKALAGRPEERHQDMQRFHKAVTTERPMRVWPKRLAIVAILAALIAGGVTYPQWKEPATHWLNTQLAGEAVQQADRAKTHYEKTLGDYDRLTAQLARPLHPAAAAKAVNTAKEAASQLRQQRYADASLQFAAATKLIGQAEVEAKSAMQLTKDVDREQKRIVAERESWSAIAATIPKEDFPPHATWAEQAWERANKERKGFQLAAAEDSLAYAGRHFKLAVQFGAKLKKARLDWELAINDLPKPLYPTEYTESARELQRSAAAVKADDRDAAIAGFDAAIALLEKAEDQLPTLLSAWRDFQESVHSMENTWSEWSTLAKAAKAKPNTTHRKAEQEVQRVRDMLAGHRTDGGVQAAQAAALLVQQNIDTLQQSQLAAASQARGQAQQKLRQTERIVAELESLVRTIESKVDRDKQLSSSEREKQRMLLKEYKSLLDAAKSSTHMADVLSKASGALAAGDALLREQPLQALLRFQQVEELCNELDEWNRNGKKSATLRVELILSRRKVSDFARVPEWKAFFTSADGKVSAGHLSFDRSQMDSAVKSYDKALEEFAKILDRTVAEVPSEFSTISVALNQSLPGMTISVAPGVYSEQIMMKRGVIIKPSRSSGNVIVRHPNTVFTAKECSGGAVENISFLGRRGSSDPVVLLAGSAVQLTTCNISAESKTRRGVDCRDSDKSTVSSCTIRSCKVGIQVAGASTVTAVRSNSLENHSDAGIQYTGGANGSAYNNRISSSNIGIEVSGSTTKPTLTQNSCKSNQVGIAIYDGSDAVVTGNQCTSNRNAGITVSGSGTSPSVTSNKCSSNTNSGIYATNGASPSISSNTCYGNRTGIVIASSARYLRVENNTCNNNDLHGIAVTAGESTLVGNTCRDNDDSGITVVGGEAKPDLRENTCHSNDVYGIYFGKSASGEARSNTCNVNGTAGIGIGDLAAPKVINNVCGNNRSYGFSVFGGAKPTLTTNKAKHNSDAGVLVSGDGTVCKASVNECSENGGSGIYAMKKAHLISESNFCNSNQKTGIAAQDVGTQATVKSSYTSFNKMNGVWIGKGATATITECKVTHNHYPGIGIFDEGTTADVISCQSNNNTQSGIYFSDGATGVARGNTANNNSDSGVCVHDGSSATIENNTTVGNTKNGICVASDATANYGGNYSSGNGWNNHWIQGRHW